jgi:iron complex transport system substrate-binding protein
LRFSRLARLSPLLAVAVVAVFSFGCGGGSSYKASESRPAVDAVDLTKDDLGRSVTISAPAKRVVAMSPSVVELIYAVGATPVGRPSSADFPEAAKSVPSFGLSYQPNYEEIAAMKPDLIVADAVIDAGPVMDSIVKLGAPVYAVRITSFDEITHSLRVVGALTGNKDAGEQEAQKLEKKLSDVSAKLPANGPSFLVLVSAGPGQFIAEKDGSYLADMLKVLKARNLVTSEPDNFRFPGFTDYSPERIVEKNPDIVLTMSLGGQSGTPKTSEALKSSPALSSLKAVKEGRVYEVDPVVYLQSAGPRVSQILDELPRLLYPSVFATAR